MNTTTSTPTIVSTPEAGHKRGCLFWLKRGLLGLVILLIALPVTGMLYEAVMAAGDTARYPAPGSLISVNDHKLHIHCVGEGSPTVVLESGFGSTSLDWLFVQPQVAEFTRICAYDRAGMGWSETSSSSRDPQHIAANLHTLLANAGIEPPYVLVGHSLGGKDIRLFAIQYPQDVAGMVFVDARHESIEPVRTPEQYAKDTEAYESSFGIYSTLRTLGVARLLGAALQPLVNPATQVFSPEIRTQMTLLGTQGKTLDAMKAESAAGMANDDQLRAATLGDLPIVVLAAGTSIEAESRWLSAQEALAGLSTNSRLTIVDGAGHNIHWDHPAEVTQAVQVVVEAVRAGQSLAE